MHREYKIRAERLASCIEETRVQAAQDLDGYVKKGNFGFQHSDAVTRFVSNLISDFCEALQSTKSHNVSEWIIYFSKYARLQSPHIFAKYLTESSTLERDPFKTWAYAHALHQYAEYIGNFEQTFCKIAFYPQSKEARGYVVAVLGSIYKSGRISEKTYRNTIHSVALADNDSQCRFRAVTSMLQWGLELKSEDFSVLENIALRGLKSDVHTDKAAARYALDALKKAPSDSYLGAIDDLLIQAKRLGIVPDL